MSRNHNYTIERDYHFQQDKCGLKLQDCVEVLKEPLSGSGNFWSWCWAPEKRDLIGKKGYVVRIDADGVMIHIQDTNDFPCFPFFMLKKVNTPACPFKTFDKVLVRANKRVSWIPAFFGKYHPELDHPYETFSPAFVYENGEGVYIPYSLECIAYEGNEHLAYTTEEPEKNETKNISR